MTKEHSAMKQLPPAIAEKLDSFSRGVHEVLGDTLVSIVLYGQVARGTVTETSPMNLMIVLGDDSTATLDRMASLVRQGRADRLTVMIVTEPELQRSTDVFPVKFLDMQHHHVLIHGEDLLKDLLITADNLRLRCEQETRNTLLRLRNLYLYRAADSEQLQATLRSAVSPFLITLNAFLFLIDGRLRPSEEEVAADAQRALKLDSDILHDLVHRTRSSTAVRPEEVKRSYQLFMSTVQRTAAIIDRFAPQK